MLPRKEDSPPDYEVSPELFTIFGLESMFTVHIRLNWKLGQEVTRKLIVSRTEVHITQRTKKVQLKRTSDIKQHRIRLVPVISEAHDENWTGER